MCGTPSSSQTTVLGEWRPPPSVAIFQFWDPPDSSRVCWIRALLHKRVARLSTETQQVAAPQRATGGRTTPAGGKRSGDGGPERLEHAFGAMSSVSTRRRRDNARGDVGGRGRRRSLTRSGGGRVPAGLIDGPLIGPGGERGRLGAPFHRQFGQKIRAQLGEKNGHVVLPRVDLGAFAQPRQSAIGP